jgi:hypothetical protein
MEASQPVTAAFSGAEGGVAAAPLAGRREPPGAPGLAELQGTWSHEATGVNGQSCRKVIEVARDRLALSIVGSDGQARVVCRGDVRLEELGPFKVLKVLDSQANASVVSTGRSGSPQAWIYRVSGQRLVLASNLEASADGRESTIETYIKLGVRR